MTKLLIRELQIQNSIYNLTKYLFIFFAFCLLTTTLINSPAQVQNYGVIFSVICIPLAFISLPTTLIKPDIDDGTMELMLISFSGTQIILAKYVSIIISGIISFILIMPIMYLMFDVNELYLLIIFECGFLLIITSSAIVILISSIQGYFRNDTNFLSVFIMPLIIPNIILSGIAIQSNSSDLILIILGIDIIIIPSSLYLSGYLMDSIYNI